MGLKGKHIRPTGEVGLMYFLRMSSEPHPGSFAALIFAQVTDHSLLL